MIATFKFSLLTTRRHSATRKHLFLYSKKVKKGYASTLTAATNSVHLPKPVSTDLTKSDSVLTKPVGKDGVRGRSM